MKAAGLNPALLDGGSGSAGQAHGATVSPATAMQPMGLQVALQAQQAAAQTALTNAQAEKIRSETTEQKNRKSGRHRNRPGEESSRSKEEQERHRGGGTKNRKPEENSRSYRGVD